jgi:hypothetical protein
MKWAAALCLKSMTIFWRLLRKLFVPKPQPDIALTPIAKNMNLHGCAISACQKNVVVIGCEPIK